MQDCERRHSGPSSRLPPVARRARLASFIGLTEVLFAVAFAWAFLGQLPTPVQLVGGTVIVVGITLVRVDELRAPVAVRRGLRPEPPVTPRRATPVSS